jgi:hypothetical protein
MHLASKVSWIVEAIDECKNIYRLYNPGDFADSMVANIGENYVTYTVHLNGRKSNQDQQSPTQVASNPFGTRTDVLSNPTSNVMVNDKPLTMLKDQMCRVRTRFNEHDILTNRVHGPGNVPGVVEVVCHEVITIPRGFCLHRKKTPYWTETNGRVIFKR